MKEKGICTADRYLKTERYTEKVRPDVKVRLTAGERFFGPGTCELLEGVEQTGSLQAACAQMQLSYTKGSRMVKMMERQLGFPVVQRWAGGNGGGGSMLTEEGRQILEAYQKMTEEIEKVAEQIFRKYFGEILTGAETGGNDETY